MPCPENTCFWATAASPAERELAQEARLCSAFSVPFRLHARAARGNQRERLVVQCLQGRISRQSTLTLTVRQHRAHAPERVAGVGRMPQLVMRHGDEQQIVRARLRP